jgi:electron transfer flavoprotein beta subunit
MRVLVPIKLNLDTSQIKFDERTGQPIYEAIPRKMGDADKCALEESLKIREKTGASVSAVTIGFSKEHYRIIRDAYAMGVDEGYVIKLDNWDRVPAIATVNILKSFIDEYGPYDVIIMGQWSNDTHSSITPAALASTLNYPLMPNIDKLEYAGDVFQGLSNMEDGVYIFKSPPPLVVSVSSEANLPRIPTLKDILRAKRKEIKELNGDKYLEGYHPLEIISILRYAVERKKEIIEIDDESKIDEALNKIIDVLKGEGLL